MEPPVLLSPRSSVHPPLPARSSGIPPPLPSLPSRQQPPAAPEQQQQPEGGQAAANPVPKLKLKFGGAAQGKPAHT